MDWSQVTAEELVSALREVDWKAPRPPAEFFGKAFAPKASQWASRVKCNLYYYRSNYLLLFIFSFVVVFLTNPRALLALCILSLAVLLLNDPFCTSFNDQLLRLVRKVHHRTALRARALSGQEAVVATQRRTSRGARKLYIVLFPRVAVVIGLVLIGTVLVYLSRAWITLSLGTVFGFGLPLLHATFRSPNLKARLASAREEFRAVWRGYQSGAQMHDYTL